MGEIWIVHCLNTGNGRSMIGIADSRKASNVLRKQLCFDINESGEYSEDEYVYTIKKVTKMNSVVIDLT